VGIPGDCPSRLRLENSREQYLGHPSSMMNAGGGIPLPPPNLRHATDMMTEIDLCPIERMERALDREIEAAMGVKCHVPAGGIGSKCGC
jgi:hypothetical protein